MTRIALVVGPFITLIYLFAPAPYGFQTELNMQASAQSVATQPNTSPPIALKSFLEQNCVACHDKDDGVDSRFYVHDDAQSWEEHGLLKPGSPENSDIFQRINSGKMPPPQTLTLSLAQRDQIQDWITHWSDDATVVRNSAGSDSDGNDVISVVKKNGHLDRILKWAEIAGIDVELLGAGPYTLFAPTDEAIEKLGPANIEYLENHTDEMKRVLFNHGGPGTLRSRDLDASGGNFRTMLGWVPYRTNFEGRWIKDARILESDIPFDKGTIHIIDRVLVPSSVKLPEPAMMTAEGARVAIWEPCGTGMNVMVGGEFFMGSPPPTHGSADIEPGNARHRVRVSSFAIGVWEVTKKQYEDVTGGEFRTRFREPPKDEPVTNVTWFEAVQYCNALSKKANYAPYYVLGAPRLESGEVVFDVTIPDPKGIGFRLPTEAEWEYACRAGQAGDYCFGNDANNLADFAWTAENSSINDKLRPVGKKRCNDYWLFDMHGNAAEWCQDWYGPYSMDGTLIEDPMGPKTGVYRVARGGSYNYFREQARSAHRDPRQPFYRTWCIGFRVARNLPPEEPIEFVDPSEKPQGNQ